MPPIKLRHDFYEVDYLPENDRTRYTIHPDARREILKRLLLLNHALHDQEVKAGLHEKGKGPKKTSKAAAQTGEILQEDGAGYGKQAELFS